MKRIGMTGVLAGVVAVVTGLGPFGQLLELAAPAGASASGGAPDGTPAALQTIAAPAAATPVASPWQAGAIVIVQLSSADGGPLTTAQVAETESVVRARLGALGGPGATVRSIPDDRLRIDVADQAWADAVRDVATAPGIVQFVPIPTEYADAVVEGEPLPAGMPIEPLFGSDGIADASIGSDQLDQPAVDIVLSQEAARVFDDFAAAHLGERFAIVRDGLVLSAPTINATSFNGRAQISGAFDRAAIASLVAIVRGGVLPVTAEIVNLCPAAGECPASTIGPAVSPGG